MFWAGGVLFSLTSIMFLLLKKKNESIASINLMVNCVTIVSYAVMIFGLGAITAPNGELIYWTRWLFYAGSCSLLMYETGVLLKKSKTVISEMIVSNIIVMIAGFLASYTIGLSRIVFFSISSGAFIYVLYLINKKSGRKSLFKKTIKWYITLFWSMFPLIWLLSPAYSMVLNAYWTAMFYLILDFITKVLYGLFTVKKKI